jgi:hypothetical protein
MTDPAQVAELLAMVISDGQHGVHPDNPHIRFMAYPQGNKLIVTLPNPIETYPPKAFELTLRRVDDGYPPPLTAPNLGGLVEPGLRDRQSAEDRARYRSRLLVDDPVYGPASGFIVGVGSEQDDDGRWPLVWVPSMP